MEWDNEYENGYNNMGYTSHRDNSVSDKGSSEAGFDPVDIANPVSAYFFLNDDAQDEISGVKNKNMKCRSCSHRFAGESYESCPECHSVNTEEAVAGIDGEEDVAEDANMKCLDCGHAFLGETYDHCPECLSSDTEEVDDKQDHGYR